MNFQYPAIFSFHVILNKEDNTLTVQACLEKTKTDVKNIKFRSIKRIPLTTKIKVAVIDIREVQSEDELKERLRDYTESWKV